MHRLIVMMNQLSKYQRNAAIGLGGHCQRGETWIGPSGAWFHSFLFVKVGPFVRQDRLKFGQVPLVLFWIVRKFLASLGRDVMWNDPQGLSGLQRTDVGFAGAFKVIESIKGFCDRIADNHDAVVAHDHDLILGVRQQGGAARAFFFKGQTAVVFIDHVTSVKRAGVLVDGGQSAVGKRRQNGCMDRMHVHAAPRMRHTAVDTPMQPPRRWVGRIWSGQGFRIVGVYDDHIACFDPTEMCLIGVHQELGSIIIDREAKVVGDPFMHGQPCCPPKSSSQINPFLPEFHIVAHDVPLGVLR